MRSTYLHVLVFISILILLFVYIGFVRILPLRPQSIHQWAQCDRASVALNFSKDTYNIFKPRVHNTANGTGITGMEFPAVNYAAGMLYRIFGFHEYLYRLLMIVLLSIGLISAFKLAQLFIADFYYSTVAVLLMFLSPVLVFYTPNFIPDAAGLGFILCGWYYFFKYRNSTTLKNLLLLSLFTSLACLIKITNVIGAGTMLILLIAEYLQSKSRNTKSAIWNNRIIAAIVLPVLLTAAWYIYASWLSETNNSEIFLLKNRPITGITQFFTVINEIRSVWFNQYFSKYMYFFILITGGILIIYKKRISSIILKTTLLLWLGNSGYFLLMMAQFPEHDYYIISMLPAVLFQTICLFSLLKSVTASPKIIFPVLKFIFLLLVLHSSWFARHIFSDRYDETSWMKSDPINNRYFDLSEFVSEIGIMPGKHVISAYDKSPDITLYLMNLKGVTVSPGADLQKITEAYRNQIEYIVLNDPDLILRPPFAALKNKFLGTRNNIYFYRIIK